MFSGFPLEVSENVNSTGRMEYELQVVRWGVETSILDWNYTCMNQKVKALSDIPSFLHYILLIENSIVFFFITLNQPKQTDLIIY